LIVTIFSYTVSKLVHFLRHSVLNQWKRNVFVINNLIIFRISPLYRDFKLNKKYFRLWPIYTAFRKKHPLTFSSISPWM